MTVKNFLKLHKGCVACVTIQDPYDYNNIHSTRIYFEEEDQESILSSGAFQSIENRQVDHFNIIGGGMYKVELRIFLKEKGGREAADHEGFI